jgi:hypothetical protein
VPTRRRYTNFPPQQTLSTSIGAGDLTLTIGGSFVGWPTQFPFYAVLDYGKTSAEVVLVTNIVTTTATITRGQDGSAALSHAAGATFDHCVVAKDLDEANAHVTSSAAVHGINGNVVGDTDTQELSNKTLDAPHLHGLTLDGGATTAGTITHTGDINVTGSVTAGNDMSITDDLTVGDDATINGDLSVAGALTVAGNVAPLVQSGGAVVVFDASGRGSFTVPDPYAATLGTGRSTHLPIITYAVQGTEGFGPAIITGSGSSPANNRFNSWSGTDFTVSLLAFKLSGGSFVPYASQSIPLHWIAVYN